MAFPTTVSRCFRFDGELIGVVLDTSVKELILDLQLQILAIDLLQAVYSQYVIEIPFIVFCELAGFFSV